MAFFRKWKTHYKHKKFTSDEVVDGEDWGLDKTVRNVPNVENMKLDLHSIEADGEEDDKPLFASYDIKYLGCTPIETKRSEKVTSEAIKTVIANSKAGGRKSKTQKRVQLNVSQDGIEAIDSQTRDSLMRFSIYKISYCSVDAAHDHAFSFVSSEKDPLSDQEKMSCHVFYCPKRKIAHEITLMVARCFENAYQHWRDAVVHHAKSQGMSFSHGDNAGITKILKAQNGVAGIESLAEIHSHQHHSEEERKTESLLIDLAASEHDMRKYLQNTWVSFDDEARDGIHIVAC